MRGAALEADSHPPRSRPSADAPSREQRQRALDNRTGDLGAQGLTGGVRFSLVVADDFDDIRDVVRIVLEASGRIVVVGEARNGREAVDLAAQHQPDAVLLDLAMPVMSGLEALPLIRRASPSTRVIVFTGLAEVGLNPESLGVDGFVEKGSPVRELVAAVLGALTTPANRDRGA